MSNEVLSRVQKRQAIERGLKIFIDGHHLLHSLNYWEQHYSDKPSFVLNRFLSEICSSEQLRILRKDMLKQVLFELSEVERQELLFRQKVKEKQQKIIKPKEVELVSGNIQDAFFNFVKLIVQHVAYKDLFDFNNAVVEELQQMGLAIDDQAKIHEQDFCDFLPITSYAKVITAIYQCFCEFYGPTKADQHYATAKNQLKTMYPEVDLHQLL